MELNPQIETKPDPDYRGKTGAPLQVYLDLCLLPEFNDK